MAGTWSIFWRAFAKPSTAYAELTSGKGSVRRAIYYMLIPIIGYTVMYVFLTIGHGAPSVFTPWLNISLESYYAVNRLLLAPSLFIAWLTATGVIWLLAGSQEVEPDFGKLLSSIGLAISISMCAGLLHDLPMSFLSAIGVLDARQHEADMNSDTVWRTLLWIAYGIYFLLILIHFPIAVKTATGMGGLRSRLTGWTGFIIFQLIFLVFNR